MATATCMFTPSTRRPAAVAGVGAAHGWHGNLLLVRNALVLVSPAKGGATRVALEPAAVAQALGTNGRLAVAETDNVPAGKYAKQSLTALGLSDAAARASLRLGFGRFTTAAEIDSAAALIDAAVARRQQRAA